MDLVIAVISFSPLASDSRILRQISTLQRISRVVTVGYGPSVGMNIEHLEVPQTSLLRAGPWVIFLLTFRWFSAFFSLRSSRKNVLAFLDLHKPDIVILNDASSWPFLADLDGRRCVVDAHEYSLGELDDNLLWRLFVRPYIRWCSRFALQAVAHFCVEPQLCRFWADYTGTNFILLRNVSPYHALPTVGSARQPIRVIHHGLAHPSRRIEEMIKAVYLAGPRFSGTFLLTGSNTRYKRYLQRLATRNAVSISPPIPQEQLILYGSHYDIGILSIYPSNPNYTFCLPNKLFQFIQSRLVIVAGPTPAVADIIERYDIGVVASDFTPRALSQALLSLTPDSILRMKANTERAARELCWENEEHVLIHVIHSIALSPQELQS